MDRAALLWAFSLEFYQGEGVASTLIDWQDALGVNVNVALCVCWVARRERRTLTEAEITRLQNAVCAWNEAVTQPIRRIRRDVKARTELSSLMGAGAFREQVKAVELDAERIEQRVLVANLDVGERSEGQNATPEAREGLERLLIMNGELPLRRSSEIDVLVAALERLST